MEIYGLKTCDTCRKAMRALPDATFIDVRADGVPDVIMETALATFGAAMVNTRSTTWRGLDETARALPAAQQLAAHPTLMKRPLIVDGASMHLGWSKDTQSALNVT